MSGRGSAAAVPTSRAGILAAGLVSIVKTPIQLDEDGGWWKPEKRKPDASDRAALRRALSTTLPYWLKPPVTPAEQVRRMFKNSDAAYRDAAKYIGDRHYTTPSEMSPAQLRTELNKQARRLAGLSDNDLDFSQN